jgi:hypothetical protein
VFLFSDPPAEFLDHSLVTWVSDSRTNLAGVQVVIAGSVSYATGVGSGEVAGPVVKSRPSCYPQELKHECRQFNHETPEMKD